MISPRNNSKTKVEFLYFKSCPSHKEALENLNAALRQTGTDEARLVKQDNQEPLEESEKPSLGRVLLVTSWRDRALFSCSQAGMINNLNDGMAWGLFPLYLQRLD